MTERWLPIPEFEGSYEVSDMGRVRGRRGVLKASIGGAGYPHVSLPCPEARSGYRVRTVHSLVLEAFVGPRPDGMQGRHLDGDRANCRLENLAYGTQVENEADKRRHGTHEKSRRTHCPLDHRLVPPNLVTSALKRGQRNCLACSRGRAAVRRGAVDLGFEADRYYHDIMG